MIKALGIFMKTKINKKVLHVIFLIGICLFGLIYLAWNDYWIIYIIWMVVGLVFLPLFSAWYVVEYKEEK